MVRSCLFMSGGEVGVGEVVKGTEGWMGVAREFFRVEMFLRRCSAPQVGR